MGDIDGVLLDIDGVLAISWEPLPGAIETVSWLRSNAVPFRLVTNTTTKTRSELAATLRRAGFDIRDQEVITAVVATAAYLRTHHPGAGCFLLSDGDASGDLTDVRLTELDDADVIVIGGAYDGFSYRTVNRIFGRLMEGALLVGMHRNLYWRTSRGLELDAGAYIAGLEEATARKAEICGKPTAAYFDSALAMLGVSRDRALMIGDDVVSDILGAQALGIRGALVKTGKFMPADPARAHVEPAFVLPTIAELPRVLDAS